MKKLFLFLVFTLLLTSLVWSQTHDTFSRANYRIQHLNDRLGVPFHGFSAYFLDGFSFATYVRTDPPLGNIVEAEVRGIQRGIRNLNGQVLLNPRVSPSYSIVGYSQGGLRALAHINETQRQFGTARLREIDAVITISAINQGLPALDGGLAGLRRRAGEKVDIVGNGLRSAIGIGDVFYILSKIIPRNQLANGLGFFMGILPSTKGRYWTEAWNNPREGILHQIDDMVPNSNFIRQNVVRTVDHTYRVRTGQRLASEWRSRRVLGVRVWYLWVGMVDVYSFFSAPERIPVFDSTVPVGFIVGTNNRTITMANNPSGIYNGIKAAEIVFGVVQGVHIIKNVSIIGLIGGGITYERDANRARKLMANIDSELHDIIRSSQGDGLVARSSQYIPRTFRDPNTNVVRTNLRNPVLGGMSEGFIRMPNNHNDIITNRNTFIWARNMMNDGRTLRGRGRIN